MLKARLVLLTSFFVLLLLLSPQPQAKSGPQETVRVAYRAFGQYMHRQPDGSYRGLLVEYMEAVARKAHLQLEPVDGGNWAHCLRLLEQGEADILPGVFYTPQRAQKMLFPALPMGNAFVTLSVRADDPRYDHARPAAFNGMRVGVVLQSKATEHFKNFYQAQNLSTTVVPFLSTAAMLTALRQGTVDGAAVAYLGENMPFKPVVRLAAEPFYLALSPRKAYLLADINAAQREMARDAADHSLELLQKKLSPCRAITTSPPRKKISSSTGGPLPWPTARTPRRCSIRTPRQAPLPASSATYLHNWNKTAACASTMCPCRSPGQWSWLKKMKLTFWPA